MENSPCTQTVKLPPFETARSSDSAPSPMPLLPRKPPRLETTMLKHQKQSHTFI